mmetsp:Transcript_50146/g.119379  ORF Transcript_50146/g.119379 Transcript_50146/m.119379 type:complete len:298 (+) Transcript_50146:87-980(+)
MSTAHYGRAVPVALRRFPKVQFQRFRLPAAPDLSGTETSENSEKEGGETGRPGEAGATEAAARRHLLKPELLLPKDIGDGVHVVLLLNRLRQIESADSWLSVREVFERQLQEQQLHREGELQMYICCLLPGFWPLRWLWRWRMYVWDDLLGEDHPAVHILSTTEWTSSMYDRLGVHNDGRAYALLIRRNGEIIWASHDKFKENKHERLMVKVIREEVQWREEEQAKLLEGAAPALPGEGQARLAGDGATQAAPPSSDSDLGAAAQQSVEEAEAKKSSSSSTGRMPGEAAAGPGEKKP